VGLFTKDFSKTIAMNTLIFATNNPNKVQEIQSILQGSMNVVSLADAGINIDIPEPHDTLEANADEKSSTIYQLTGQYCFSEDTGLEVEALNGMPGVRSARFVEPGENYTDNIEKLLHHLQHHQNRKARFRTVISLINETGAHQFEGVCEGSIINERRGEGGFGYDSVFVPKGASTTFAEMTMAEKNKFSHRKKAMSALIQYLQKLHGKS
jgi:XTP/dITP diphosphohydrolase